MLKRLVPVLRCCVLLTLLTQGYSHLFHACSTSLLYISFHHPALAPSAMTHILLSCVLRVAPLSSLPLHNYSPKSTKSSTPECSRRDLLAAGELLLDYKYSARTYSHTYEVKHGMPDTSSGNHAECVLSDRG